MLSKIRQWNTCEMLSSTPISSLQLPLNTLLHLQVDRGPLEGLHVAMLLKLFLAPLTPGAAGETQGALSKGRGAWLLASPISAPLQSGQQNISLRTVLQTHMSMWPPFYQM